ncbi:MAG: NAD-dependent epimerase/dehydratase family protein, partial [Capsulimonadales bacterium]|nr:NAD-dependent epimerase/dehydratase family protein [Capsulimonadales bacterium]
MHLLVTGSEGGVGRALIPLLQEQGHTVRGFDVAESANGDYDYVRGDLRDMETVRKVAPGIETIIHAGAIAHDRKDHEDEVLAS